MSVTINLCFIIIISLVINGVYNLKDVCINVPSVVQVNQTVLLTCSYDLEGELLYTLKWYKGNKEIYRHIPKEYPDTKVFPLPGINVDLSETNKSNIHLRNVQLEVTGRYKCEVSSDAPNFDTKMTSGYIHVIDVPSDEPFLSIDQKFMDVGIQISGNCSTGPSYPAANISWYINNKKIPYNPSRQLQVLTNERKYFTTLSAIHLEIAEEMFENGKAVIKCVVKLFNAYQASAIYIIEEPKLHSRPLHGPISAGDKLQIHKFILYFYFIIIIVQCSSIILNLRKMNLP